MTGPAAAAPMRLAVVIESFNLAAGGNERSTDQIIAELVRRGHDVTLIAGAVKRAHMPGGVETLRLSKRKSASTLRLLRFRRWATRKLAEGNFDASLSMTMAVPASVLQPRGGTVRETLERNVAMRGGGWPSTKKRIELALNSKQQLLLRLERRTLANPGVQRVAALSRYVVRQLEEHYRYPAERTVVIPNAAVMPPVDGATRATWRHSIRRSFGVADGEVAYLFAAQNPGLKGYPTLLKALATVRERGVPAVLLLAGRFAYKEHRKAADAGLREHVRFVDQTSHMQELYAAADATVLPTWYDPSSKVVLESLMMRVPAISTAYNGASDHLLPESESPRGEVIADPGSDAQLADAMIRLADAERRAACAAACEGLDEALSMRRHVDALERVLAEVAR